MAAKRLQKLSESILQEIEVCPECVSDMVLKVVKKGGVYKTKNEIMHCVNCQYSYPLFSQSQILRNNQEELEDKETNIGVI